MDIVGIEPSCITLKPFSSIRFTLLQSPAADLLPATLNLLAISALGKQLWAIVDGALQPGWEGVILPAGIGPHEYLTVTITMWPPEITSPEIWTFQVSVGGAL